MIKRVFPFALLIVMIGCTDRQDPAALPVVEDPCAKGCLPPSLVFGGYEILWRTADHTVYSGDTLQVRVEIHNYGGPADSVTISASSIKLGDGGHIRVKIPARGTTEAVFIDTVPVVIASISHLKAATTAAWSVSVSWVEGTERHSLTGIQGTTLPFVPTYMTMTGPDTVRTEQDYQYTLQIVNPSPNSIHSASIGACVFYYNCITPVFYRVQGPNVPPRTNVSIVIPVRISRSWNLALPTPGNVAACYGFLGVSTECGYKPAVLVQ